MMIQRKQVFVVVNVACNQQQYLFVVNAAANISDTPQKMVANKAKLVYTKVAYTIKKNLAIHDL